MPYSLPTSKNHLVISPEMRGRSDAAGNPKWSANDNYN